MDEEMQRDKDVFILGEEVICSFDVSKILRGAQMYAIVMDPAAIVAHLSITNTILGACKVLGWC